MPRKKIKNMADVEREFRILILKLDKYNEDNGNEIRRLKVQMMRGKKAVCHKKNRKLINGLRNETEQVELCVSALRLAYRATNLVDAGCDEEEWQSIEGIVGTTYPKKEK